MLEHQWNITRRCSMRKATTRGGLVLLGLIVLGGLVVRTAEAVTGGHNLSGIAPGGQVCIACHAPHKVPNSPLLWNHVLSAANFSWSDWTQTTGGTPLPKNIKTWSGSTKLCLSCHDGTVAIGALADGTTFSTAKISSGDQIGGGGDLKGNHPVAVPYPYNGVKNTYNGIVTGDNALASGWKAVPTKVKIFTDAGAAAPNNRGVECASCHDPHGTGNSDYLRDTTSGSALCLNCHTK